MPESGGSAGHGPGAAELQGGPAPAFHGKTILVIGSGDVLAPMLAAEAARRGAAATAGEAAADVAGCDLLVDAFLARFGRIDAAIATVAAPPIGALTDMSLDAWQSSVIAPLRQAFWLARRVIWEFLAGGNGGRLVFVTEPPRQWAAGAAPGNEPNAVVGGALYSLARSIAKEVGSRAVACNVVLAAPAPRVAGRMSRGDTRPASADDLNLPLIESALYLASEDASFVNGEALTVRVGGQEPGAEVAPGGSPWNHRHRRP
jgi:3-oxoacyl-[acyl-carrier protein] reductase